MKKIIITLQENFSPNLHLSQMLRKLLLSYFCEIRIKELETIGMNKNIFRKKKKKLLIAFITIKNHLKIFKQMVKMQKSL